MSGVISTEYKGQTIEYLEHVDQWVWNDYRNTHLGDVKKHIDRHISKIWLPTRALMKDYNNILKPVMVRSVSQDGTVWIDPPRAGERRQKAQRPVYVDSKRNQELFAEVLERIERIDELEREVNDLVDHMERFRAEHLHVKEKDDEQQSNRQTA